MKTSRVIMRQFYLATRSVMSISRRPRRQRLSSRSAARAALRWEATTTTAVTGGAPAREPAGEEASPASAGDGRAHASTNVLRRGVEGRRSVLAARADHPRDPVPHRLHLTTLGQTRVRRRAQTAKAVEAKAPTAALTRAAAPRSAHQRTQATPPRAPRALEAPSRPQPRRTVARTWTGDTTGKQTRRRPERRSGWPRRRAPSPRPSWRKATTRQPHHRGGWRRSPACGPRGCRTNADSCSSPSASEQSPAAWLV